MVYKMKCKKLSHLKINNFSRCLFIKFRQCPLELKYNNVIESYLKTNIITIDNLIIYYNIIVYNKSRFFSSLS